MRIAIVSDIHGNRTAFEAVLADLRQTSPDLILHGGDLAEGGASPAEIVDRIRDLGWQGVVGNTDEMLFMPDSLTEFANQSPKLQPLFTAIEEMAAATREALGEERLAWLRGLPRIQIHGSMALVHASPETPWRAPAPEASDAELESVYGSLSQPTFEALPEGSSPIQAASVFLTMATGALHTSCWMNPSRQSSAWSMTWTRSLKLSPVAVSPTPIGLPGSSKAAPPRCRK